jgi:hypothetical protein
MTTEITKTETFSALDANIGADMDGVLLRFNGKVGKFFKGAEKEEVPFGRRLKLAPPSVQDGWQKWDSGKIGDQRFREWNSTQPPIFRDELGDMHEDAWPEGKDPWSGTILVALRDAKGEMLKFATNSKGGENAIRRVLREWRRDRAAHPGEVPVVELGCDSYVHKKHRTEIITPRFMIVGWCAWDDDMAAMTKVATSVGLKATTPPTTPKALPPGGVTTDDPRTMQGSSLSGELDDLIPFSPEWRG